MGKKKKHPEHENLERWLVSYADFITLLFATFTALYALSMNDLAKFKDMAEGIKAGFKSQSLLSGIESVLGGKSAPAENPTPISLEKGAGPGVIGEYESLTYTEGEVKRVEEVYEDLKKDVEDINKQVNAENKAAADAKGSDSAGSHAPNLGEAESPVRGIEVSQMERGLKVSFDSRLLFQPGTAVLMKDSEKMLNTIADRLKPFDEHHVIHIEGHTDNQPINSALYPSNWELSAARASTVVRYLIKNKGFHPTSLVAVGYGDSQPLASNTTPEGRRKNRRVDIIIYSRKASDPVTPSERATPVQKLIEFKDDGVIRSKALVLSESYDPSDEYTPVKVMDDSGTVEMPKARVVSPTVVKPIQFKPPMNGHDAHTPPPRPASH